MAFVLFADQESLKQALEFNGQEYNGRTIRVNRADEKPPKRDGGNFRGNDRGRGGNFRGGRGGNRGGRGGNFRGNSNGGGFRNNGFGTQSAAPSNTKVVFDD